MRKTLLCAALLSAAAVAGCSSSTTPAAAPAAPASSAAASASPSPAPATSAADPSPTGTPLGSAQSASALGVTIKATPATYKVITLSADNAEQAAAGTQVALVQAMACVTANNSGQGIALTWTPWTLVTTDGATVKPLDTYEAKDFPGSLYPNDSQSATPVGRCRSGLIPFSLAGITGAPAMVEYNVHGIVLDWALGWVK